MFRRGVVGYLPANIVQGLAGFLGVYLFTRLLPPESYGRYAIAFGITSLVHTLLFTWIEAAMARFQVAESDSGAEAAHARTLYGLYAAFAGLLPLAALGVLWLSPAPRELNVAIAVGLVSAVARCFVRIGQERRRAEGAVGAFVALDVAQSFGGLLFGVVLAWLGAGAASPAAGLGIITALCAIYMLSGDLKRARGGRFEPARARRYAAYAVPVSLAMMFSILLFTADRVLIAAFLGETNAGGYHAGYSLANRSLDVIFIWLGSAGWPAAVTAFERGGLEALQPVAREQASLMALITLPAATGLALVARPLTELMVGPQLRDIAAHVTPWIVIAALFAGASTYYLHYAFTLAKRTGLLTAVLAAPAAVNIALNLLLIPRFGLDGALWATVASFVFGAGLAYAVGRRLLPLPLPWRTLGRSGLACLGMMAAVLAMPAVGGAVELAGKVAVGVAVYGLLAFTMDAGGVRSQGPRLLRRRAMFAA